MKLRMLSDLHFQPPSYKHNKTTTTTQDRPHLYRVVTQVICPPFPRLPITVSNKNRPHKWILSRLPSLLRMLLLPHQPKHLCLTPSMPIHPYLRRITGFRISPLICGIVNKFLAQLSSAPRPLHRNHSIFCLPSKAMLLLPFPPPQLRPTVMPPLHLTTPPHNPWSDTGSSSGTTNHRCGSPES